MALLTEMLAFFGSKAPPPQLTYGKPINIYADIPIFPPFAMMLTVACSQIIRKLTGKPLAFLPAPLSTVPVRVAFFAIAFPSIILMVLNPAGGELKAAGSGTLFTPVNGLATTGIYESTRNPMYAGLVFVAIPCMACVVNSAWPILISPLTWCYLNYVVIAAEEKLLAQAFGKQFDEYCQSVPRWLI